LRQELESSQQALETSQAGQQRLRQVVEGLREQLSHPLPELRLAQRALAEEQARNGRLADEVQRLEQALAASQSSQANFHSQQVQQLEQALAASERERTELRQQLFAALRRCDDMAEEAASYALEIERQTTTLPRPASSPLKSPNDL
jgi:hypothetical protein